MPWVTLLLGAAQIGMGAAQKSKANKDAKKALSQRVAYKTPDEIFKQLQATEYNAQNGFDPVTLNYLTNQTDRAFDSTLGTAERLGANPNDLSAIFDQKIQGIMKIGAENHSLNMENFNKYLGALGQVASGKDAEWQDKENRTKDLQQQAAQAKQEATQQISQGINTGISGLAQMGESDLFTEKDKDKFDKAYGSQGSSAYEYAKSNNWSFSKYKKESSKSLKTLGASLR